MRSRSWVRWCALSAVAVLVGCTTSSGVEGASPTRSGVPGGNSAGPASSGPFVRTCEASVYGDLGTDWRVNSLVAGPIAFLGFGRAGPRTFSASPAADGRYQGIKALAVVDEGAEVVVSVSDRDRAHAALLYDPASFRDDGRYALADGDSAVDFRSCPRGGHPLGPDGPTQFNGGFIVDGPRCVTLEVLNVQSGARSVANIAFGRGTCAARS